MRHHPAGERPDSSVSRRGKGERVEGLRERNRKGREGQNPVTLVQTSETIQSENSMKSFNPLVLVLLLVTQSASTQAADLNGAWTIDASACSKVFTKENNQLAFRRDADLNAGGLIVRGKQITGTFQKCTVKSLH